MAGKLGKETKKYIVKVIAEGLKEAVTGMAKLNKETQVTTAATDKLNSVNTKSNRLLQGVAGSSSSAARNNAKLQASVSGLVGIYAPLAANIFAVSAAFTALRKAADYAILTKSVEEYGIRAGTSLSKTSKDVKALTLNLVSLEEAMRQVSIATAAGFDPGTIKELTKVATNASLALGRDLSDSLERVFRGAIKAEPELLDELGIILRLEPATKKYAVQLGKAVSELTTFEKQQAIVNEVIEQGNKKFGDITSAIPVNSLSELAASFSEVTKDGLNLINLVLLPIAAFFASNSNALTAIIGIFVASILKKAIPAMQDFSKTLNTAILKSTTKAAAASDKYARSVNKMSEAVTDFKTVHRKNFASVNTDLDRYLKTAEDAGKKGGITRKLLNTKGIENDTKEYYDKLINSLGSTIGKLNNKKTAKGFVAADIDSLKELQKQAKIARSSIVSDFTRVGEVTTGVFGKITLAGSGAMSALTSKVSLFAATTTNTLLGTAAAVNSKGFFGGIASSIRGAMEVSNQYNVAVRENSAKNIIRYNKVAAAITGVEKAYKGILIVGSAVTTQFIKLLPVIAQAVILWEVLSTVVGFGARALGIITKEQDAFNTSVAEAESILISVAKATKFYNENLAIANGTLEDSNSQLKHQIGRLRDIQGALKDIKAQAGGKKSPLDGLLASLGDTRVLFGGIGAIAKYRKELVKFTESIKEQGLSKEVDALYASLGNKSVSGKGVINLDVGGLRAYNAGLIKILETADKLRQKSLDVNDDLAQSFTRLGKAAASVAGQLPKLDGFELAAIATADAIDRLKDRSTVEIISLMQTLKPIELVSLGIKPSDLESAGVFLSRFLEQQGSIQALTDSKNKKGLELVDIRSVKLMEIMGNFSARFVKQLKLSREHFSGIRDFQQELVTDFNKNNAALRKSNITEKSKVLLLRDQVDIKELLLSLDTEQLVSAERALKNDAKNDKLKIELARIRKASGAFELKTRREVEALEAKIYNIEVGQYELALLALKTKVAEANASTEILQSNSIINNTYDAAIQKQDEILQLEIIRFRLQGKSNKRLEDYIIGLKAVSDANKRTITARANQNTDSFLNSERPTSGTTSELESKLLKLQDEYLDRRNKAESGFAFAAADDKVAVYEASLVRINRLDARYANDREALNEQAFLRTLKSVDKKRADFRLIGTTTQTSLTSKADSQYSSGALAVVDELVSVDSRIAEDNGNNAQLIEQRQILLDRLLSMQEIYSAKMSEINRAALINQTAQYLSSAAQVGSAILSVLQDNNKRSVEATNAQYRGQVETANKGLEDETIALRSQVDSGLITRKNAVTKLAKLEERKNAKLKIIEKARVAEQDKSNRRQFESNKKLAQGVAILSTLAGIANALEDGNAFTIAAKIAAVTAVGYAQVRKIGQTQFDSGAPVANVAAISGIPSRPGDSSGAGQGNQGSGGTTTITVLGKKGIVYDPETIEELLDEMKLALDRGDRVLIDKTSRNGQELINEARIT